MRKQRKTVGIIDNDASALTAAVDLLDACGFTTISFSSAEQFLISAAKKQIDCLLVDIHLNGLSGIELRHRLKTSHPALPVIFMTGLDDNATRRRALEAGCVTFLRKPFSARQLVDAIEKVVAERK
jgi:FixJ family two-component response regulator